MKTIHTRIRERREALKLTRLQLAELCNVKYQAVQQWEREPVDGGSQSTAPKRERLRAVARALGVTEQWLLTGTDSDGNPADPNEDQLVDLYRRMSPEWQAHLLEQANNLYNLTTGTKSKPTRADPWRGKKPPKE